MGDAHHNVDRSGPNQRLDIAKIEFQGALEKGACLGHVLRRRSPIDPSHPTRLSALQLVAVAAKQLRVADAVQPTEHVFRVGFAGTFARETPCATDPLGGLVEHDLGEAREGLEFSVERDATDAIDAADASAPNEAEDEFRAADESEGLSDHQETSSCVRMSHGLGERAWPSGKPANTGSL
jgi:hypothetical protein